jgi:Predicted membrane protein (DUF2306)
MSTLAERAVLSSRDWSVPALRMLTNAARSWFVVAALGQLIFAYYIAVLYGASALRGDWAAWNKVMPRGWNVGDTVGNIAIAVHLLFALILTVGGMLQIVPQLRSRMPAFHRWNGRLYLLSGVAAALGGTYLIWVRGTVGDTSQHLATTLNAILIVCFAAMAWRYARARDFVTHRRWALRLFLVMSGVWFFRVGLMLWLLIHQAPVGFDGKTFTGPFLTALAFGQTLLPLLILELYFYAQKHAATRGRLAMTGLLAVLTLATAVGIVGATMMLWWPRL